MEAVPDAFGSLHGDVFLLRRDRGQHDDMAQLRGAGEERSDLRPDILLHEEGAGAAVIQEIEQVLGLRGWIDRYGHGANLGGAEKDSDKFRRVRHGHQDAVFRLEAQRAQAIAAAVDHLRQLFVIQTAAVFVDGDILAAPQLQIAVNKIAGNVELVRHVNCGHVC